MRELLECWIRSASALFSQALSGEPVLERRSTGAPALMATEFSTRFSGEVEGSISAFISAEILSSPLLGEGTDQAAGWSELLREISEAATGELLARVGKRCRVESLSLAPDKAPRGERFELGTAHGTWQLWLLDETRSIDQEETSSPRESGHRAVADIQESMPPAIDRLWDIELDATLRFGCREMPLGEILNLGPGDVVELDRHVTDPVDLIVGDKIVAKGDVVLVNGSFALRVASVAEPKLRLDGIRCPF